MTELWQGTDDYIASDELSRIVNVSIMLGRPLLIKGEPGTGKTLLAESIAKGLNMPLLTWHVKSTTKARDGLYVYDTVQRLYDSRFHDKDVSDIAQYIGQEIDCVILKIDETRRNIVVSRRKLIEDERDKMKKELLERITEGDLVKGVVKNIADFGAFVDLGGIDGLLHITDMSWGRINHPSEMVKIDDEIEIKGVIENFAADSFEIRGFPVSFDQDTEIDDDIAELENGLYVEVEGQLNGTLDTLIAEEIELEDDGIDDDADDVELDGRTLGEGLEALGLDGAVMDEAVLAAVLRRDEAEALLIVEPLHGSRSTHQMRS